MGTSLSGLTPATTFDGLLKTSDNEPLDGTLKAISTGDGTDTILQLSTTALSIGGATTIDVGNGHPTADNGLYLGDGGKLKLSNYFQEGIINVPAGRLRVITSQGVGIGTNFGNTTAANTTLSVKGSGATSATTSLLVQNSAGTTGFQVDDGGNIGLGNAPLTGIKVAQTSGAARFRDLYFGNIGSSAINNSSLTSINWNGSTGIGIANSEALAATAMLHIKGSGNDNTTTSLLVQNSDGTDLLKVADDARTNFYGLIVGSLNIGNNTPIEINGSTALIGSSLTNEIKLGTGFPYEKVIVDNSQLIVKGRGATSATTALLVQNSAGTEHLKITDDGYLTYRTSERVLLTLGNGSVLKYGDNSSFSALYNRASIYDGTNTTQFENGNVGIGNGTTTPTARLQVKGSGNDATTTALLVQNSDGLDMLEVDDSGNVGIGSPNPLSATLHISSQSYFNNTTALRIQNSIGNNLFRIKGDGTTDILNSKYIFNQSGISTGGAIFKGSGATSATTALLVENSAGTDLLSVRDDGYITMANNAFQILSSRLVSYRPAVFGGAVLDSSAVLEAQSTTQGFLPPRMTETERDAITSPAAGLMVYNTTTNKAQCYNGTTWNDLF